MASELEIRPYRPGDETSIVAAWNAIFPQQDGLEPRDESYWAWQFRDNTVQRTEVIVACAGGSVVGQYASVPQRAVDEGKVVTIGLVADAFVLPAWRRAGGRPGLIVHLARELHRSYCGPRARRTERGHSLLYGYPVPIWRIAQRYLASEMVRDMDVLFVEPGSGEGPSAASSRAITVEQGDAAVRAGDALWARVAPEVRFGIVRDSTYLDWRYARHPQRHYDFLLARDEATGEARGLAVYGRGAYAANEAAIVCDWLVPVDDTAAEEVLLHALMQRARSDGAVLLAVLPQMDPRFLRWQRRGFLVGPPSHFLVMNTFQHHVRYLRDRWFFTLGDSDLV